MPHAHLQPSSAKRWMVCPGSARLSAVVPDPGNEAADQGTACHWLLERHLHGVSVCQALGTTVTVGDAESGRVVEVPVTEEMVEWVLDVVGWVEQYLLEHPGAKLFTERRVEVGRAFGCPDELWGTGDLVIVTPDELVVADAKFGFVEVDIEGNEQVSLYTIGEADAYAWRFPQYRLVILQPRSAGPHKVEVLTRDELQDRLERYRAPVAAALQPDAPLVATDEGCRWCRAAGVCPELKRRVYELARREFQQPELLTPEELGAYVRELEQVYKVVSNAQKTARSHALQLVTLGTKVPGWKRVKSKKHRQWKSVPEAEEALALLGPPELYHEPAQLVSPAQAEKVLKLKPKTLYELSPAPEGEPVLAPEDDERPALDPEFQPEPELLDLLTEVASEGSLL